MPSLDSNAQAGKHYYSGSCSPDEEGRHISGQISFSVGIFQMVPKASGKGLKKTGAKVRVIGYCHDPEAVYKLADEICLALDNGTYKGSRLRRA